MDQNSKIVKPSMADMNTDELQEEFDKLVILKGFYQSELVEVKLKLAEAGRNMYNGSPMNKNDFASLNRRKVELSTSIDRAQIDMGRLSREIKGRMFIEENRKSNHTAGMTERLFMQIAKETLSEEQYNEIYLAVKMRMLDI